MNLWFIEGGGGGFFDLVLLVGGGREGGGRYAVALFLLDQKKKAGIVPCEDGLLYETGSYPQRLFIGANLAYLCFILEFVFHL